MQQNIKFTDLSAEKLFKDFYVVPEYQREYVWGEKEVQQLMTDIYTAFSVSLDSEYFLGSIVVCKGKGSHKYEVIDGQQRLITLSLFLNNLRRIYKEREQDYSAIEQLLLSQSITESGDTLKSHIIEIMYEGKDVLEDLYNSDDDGEINPRMTEGLPGKTIFDAHQTISLFMKQNFDYDEEFDGIKHFLGYFLNKVKLIQIETPEIGTALKIFETINERGVGLDQVDLLKNMLFMKIGRKEFTKLQKEWEKFKKYIQGRKVKEKPLRFLRYFIMANYEIQRDRRGSSIVREEGIYDWFVENEKDCGYNSTPFTFVRKIQENADFYMNLLKNRYGEEQNVNIENIHRLVGSAFKQHFILLLSARLLKKEWFNQLLKQLEVLLFYYNITREPPRDIERRFADWTKELRKIRSKKDFNEFITSRIKADVDNRNRMYETNFLNLRGTEMQKYKLKYILAKLSWFVDSVKFGEKEDRSLERYLKRSVHIEHILPKTPTKEILDAFTNKEEYDEYKEKLGNLVLLEQPINTSIKRGYFSQKRKTYDKSTFYLTQSICKLEDVGRDTSVIRLNKRLIKFSRWDKSAIDKRQKMLLDLSRSVWCVEPFTD